MRSFLPVPSALLCLSSLLLGSCAVVPANPQAVVDARPASPAASAVDKAASVITTGALLAHIETLASDAFEGRAPGGTGEALTVDYITGQFKALGLAPGNPDGSYLQRVPMMGTQSAPSLTFSAGGRATPLRFPDDFVAFSALAHIHRC